MNDPEQIEAGVAAFLDRVRSAWNTGDASAYAAEFAEDATYVIFLGEAFIGRPSIERNHREVFQRWQKGTRMVVTPIEIRRLAPGAVVVLTKGGIGKGSRVRPDKLQTYCLALRDGRWICQAFQNTQMSRRARRDGAVGRLGWLGRLLGDGREREAD